MPISAAHVCVSPVSELALNALALQDPEDAWLDVHSDPWLAAHTVPGASPPAFPLAGAADLDGGPADVSVQHVM
eukprot:scaffold160075_cov18-Tisochrysis_lutea.AAC.2